MRIRKIAAMLLFLVLMAVSSCASAEKTDMAHYLLVGVDGWGLNTEGSARSDAIILASLDYERERILFTSFARDSIVKPSYRKGTVKLNTLVRSSEGEQVLADYFEEAFEVKIEGYFVINFSGAVDVINALGGVELNLSEDEVYYINYHAGDYYGYPLSPGLCRVNGAQALYYMRCRNLDNDFGRQGRQGNVLRALMKKVSSITPLRAMGLLDDVLPMVTTDMGNGEILGYATKVFPMLSGATMSSQRIPADGAYYGAMIDGMSVLVADMDKTRELLRSTIGD